MLRSFDALRHTAKPEALISGDEGRVALQGGGGGYAVPWHWHDCLMILLPNIGALEFRHEDRPDGGWLSEGQFAIVPTGRAHETSALRGDHNHIALYVRDAALKHLEFGPGSLRSFGLAGQVAVYQATPDVRALQALCRGCDGPGRSAALDHLAAALLIRCLSAITVSDPLPMTSRRAHGSALVAEIKAFLAIRIEDTISIDRLAERFGVSRRHMTRMFRERTGQSILEYSLNARLEMARRLLCETDMPVGEIAFRVGFDSGSTLSRAMRKGDGRSPSDIRSAVARSAKR